MQIIPTVLEKNFTDAETKILLVKDLVKRIQVDVIDGTFNFGKTFELELINRIDGTESILWETHLMVKEPINWIEKSIHINATRIIGQVEMMSSKEDFITRVKDAGLEAGLAFDIETKIDGIPEETDVVLLLGRKSGFESLPMDEDNVYKKIEQLVRIRNENNLKFLIGVDGGVNKGNIKKLEDAGVEIAYCGGAVFNGKVENNLKELNYVSQNK
jgi:ribulose-phosphate 3-epimerase